MINISNCYTQLETFMDLNDNTAQITVCYDSQDDRKELLNRLMTTYALPSAKLMTDRTDEMGLVYPAACQLSAAYDLFRPAIHKHMYTFSNLLVLSNVEGFIEGDRNTINQISSYSSTIIVDNAESLTREQQAILSLVSECKIIFFVDRSSPFFNLNRHVLSFTAFGDGVVCIGENPNETVKANIRSLPSVVERGPSVLLSQLSNPRTRQITIPNLTPKVSILPEGFVPEIRQYDVVTAHGTYFTVMELHDDDTASLLTLGASVEILEETSLLRLPVSELDTMIDIRYVADTTWNCLVVDLSEVEKGSTLDGQAQAYINYLRSFAPHILIKE